MIQIREEFLPEIPSDFESCRRFFLPEVTKKIALRAMDAIQAASQQARSIVGARPNYYHEWLCRLTHAILLGVFSLPTWDRNGELQDVMGERVFLFDFRTPDPGYWLRVNGTKSVRGDVLRLEMINLMARMANGEKIPPIPRQYSVDSDYVLPHDLSTLWHFQQAATEAYSGKLIDRRTLHPKGSHAYYLSNTAEGRKSQRIVYHLGVLVRACHDQVDPFDSGAREAEESAIQILTTILEAVTEEVPHLAPRPWGWNNPLWHASFQRLCELAERMC
jgi:hypothetical protein